MKDFNELFVKVSFALRNATEEIVQVVLDESKRVYLEKKKSGVTTGLLLASFNKEPVKSNGVLSYSGVVYAGGPSAPYAVYVDSVGWKLKEGGHRDAYNFMQAGADKGSEMAQIIVNKHLKLMR